MLNPQRVGTWTRCQVLVYPNYSAYLHCFGCLIRNRFPLVCLINEALSDEQTKFGLMVLSLSWWDRMQGPLLGRHNVVLCGTKTMHVSGFWRRPDPKIFISRSYSTDWFVSCNCLHDRIDECNKLTFSLCYKKIK